MSEPQQVSRNPTPEPTPQLGINSQDVSHVSLPEIWLRTNSCHRPRLSSLPPTILMVLLS